MYTNQNKIVSNMIFNDIKTWHLITVSCFECYINYKTTSDIIFGVGFFKSYQVG